MAGDEEVNKQIAHMVNFIEQEAKEKVDEINVKAEEDFNIEKGRLVQQEKLKIMQQYERKEKQVEVERKIASSNALNAARLRLLEKQDALLKGIFEVASKRLSEQAHDKAKNKAIYEGLVTESLVSMLEENVEVRTRKSDLDIVKSVIGAAVAKATEMSKQKYKVTVMEDQFLPEDCCGGIEMSAQGGRIKVVNTLQNRLDAATSQTLPAIRHSLFGASSSRSFFD